MVFGFWFCSKQDANLPLSTSNDSRAQGGEGYVVAFSERPAR